MPVINLGQNRRYDAPRETSTATGSEMVTSALAGLGETVAGVSAEIADTLIEKKAQIETAKASRAAIEAQGEIESRANEYRDAAIGDGFDPETDEGRAEIERRMRADYVERLAPVIGGIETGRASDRFRVVAEKLGGNFDQDVSAIAGEIQRDAAITNAITDVESLANGVKARVRSPKSTFDALGVALDQSEQAWEARGQHLSASEKKQQIDTSRALVKNAFVASLKEHAFANPQEAKDFIRKPYVRQRMVELGFKGGEVDGLEQELISFSQTRNYETALRRIRDADGDLNPLNANLSLSDIAGNHDRLAADLERMAGDDLSIGQVVSIEAQIAQRRAALDAMLSAQGSLDSGLPISADNSDGLDMLASRVLSDPNIGGEQKDQWMIDASTTAGFIPRPVAQDISAGFRGDIPQMVRSKRVMDRLTVTNPALVRNAIDKDHTLSTDAQMVYQTMSDLDYLGEEKAAAMAQETLRAKAQDGAEYERNRQYFNEKVAGLSAKTGDRDYFPDPNGDSPLAETFRDKMDSTYDVGGFGIGIYVEPEARNDMFQHFAQTYRDLASVYGVDDGSVANLAWEMTQASYGQSEFGVPQGPLAFDGRVAEVLGIEPGRAIDQNFFAGIAGAGPINNIISRLEPYTHEKPLVRKPIENEFQKAGLNPQNGRRDLFLEVRDALPDELKGKLEIEETWLQSGIGDRNITFDGKRVFVRYDEAASESAGRPTYSVLIDGLGGVGIPLPTGTGPTYYQPPRSSVESKAFKQFGKNPEFYTFGEAAIQGVLGTLKQPDIRIIREEIEQARAERNKKPPSPRFRPFSEVQ